MKYVDGFINPSTGLVTLRSATGPSRDRSTSPGGGNNHPKWAMKFRMLVRKNASIRLIA